MLVTVLVVDGDVNEDAAHDGEQAQAEEVEKCPHSSDERTAEEGKNRLGAFTLFNTG